MLSRHSKNVYPVNPDITEFDLNTDVEEYNYDGRDVLRGNIDPDFSTTDIHVYWLYNDDNRRIGCVEHIGEEHTCYWFRDNVFSSLMQEEWTAQDRTIWNIMSEEAYEDCMRRGLDTPEKLKPYTAIKIVLPQDIVEYKHVEKSCIKCSSTNVYKNCMHEQKEKTFDIYYTIFVDLDGVIYAPPDDTNVYATLRRRAGAGAGAGDTTTAGVCS
jgi:hypothetical protein